ncbi:hypothetical protein WDU94_012054, partial [Cyamophila willieti]
MLEPITGSKKSLLFEKGSLQNMSSSRNKKYLLFFMFLNLTHWKPIHFLSTN